MTTIEWTDRVWNPVTGCTKVSQGCKNCYAEGIAARRLPHGGFTDREFTEVRCHPERLALPLSWRKPQRVFVNSMSDLFHEDVPDEFIGNVFAAMGHAHQHTYQVLTKRPARMHDMVQEWKARGWMRAHDYGRPRNVWLGVSVEDQATANERIPLLLQTPAAKRFVSYEPALGPVHFNWDVWRDLNPHGSGLDWVIVGGESGPGARPFDIAWARSVITQCRAADVPVFVKQLGARVTGQISHPNNEGYGVIGARLNDRKGGDMSEWPADLRVREFPR